MVAKEVIPDSMAMKNCPTCGEQIARRAALCPHCGRQFTTTFTRFLWIGVIAFFVFVLVAVIRDRLH
jgi:predicted amidophosphoribosyltransferase